jgi:hypothetical protein
MLVAFVVAALVCLSLAKNVVILRQAMVELPLGGDAYAYMAAGQAIAHGDDPWSANPVVYTPTPRPAPIYLYSPLVAVAFLPFAYMPFSVALAVWLGVVALTTLLLVWSLKPFLGLPLAVVAVGAFLPTWVSLYLGQINAAVAVATAVALLQMERGRDAHAGVGLGLGTLMKFAPGLCLAVLVARRSWRAVIAASVVAVLAVIVTLPWMPLATWLGSLEALFRTKPNGLFVSWPAFIGRSGIAVAPMLSLLVTVVIIAVTLWCGRRTPTMLALTAATLAPLLVTMSVWQYSMVLALPALAVLWGWGRRGRLLAGAAWVCLGLVGGMAIPLVLTLCWAACCFPHLLLEAQQGAAKRKAF